MKSFLQGKRSLDVASLRAPQNGVVQTGDAAKTPAECEDASGSAPHIELIKQGDKIVRIIVTCTCGERTEIDCLYPPGQ